MSCEKTVRPEFTRHCFTPSTGGKRPIQPFPVQIVPASTTRYRLIFNKLG